MDELYRSLHGSSSISSSCPNFYSNSNYFGGGDGSSSNHHQVFVSTAVTAPQQVFAENHEQVQGLEMSDIIFKAQIANHPLYPNLLSAYIDCRKVGAPPEMASLLEEISRANHPMSTTYMTQIGTDSELDDFMKSYCEVLHKYKEELSKPFDEAASFLSSIESQLSSLCNNETLTSTTYSPGVPSDEDTSCGEVEGAAGASQECHQELKEMLMRKYSGYLSSLKKDFLKKRKKGKLPKDARTTLLHWWNTHYRWPYPTEEEKNRLSEMTGLDQKQINNWFINQRKRHWRPSEDMRFALMEGVSTGAGITATAAESNIFFDPN